jgi:hypothetical protein
VLSGFGSWGKINRALVAPRRLGRVDAAGKVATTNSESMQARETDNNLEKTELTYGPEVSVRGACEAVAYVRYDEDEGGGCMHERCVTR